MNLFTFNSEDTEGESKFSEKILLFVFGFVLFFLFCNYVHQYYLNSVYRLYQKQIEYYNNVDRSLKVLFLGDSHVAKSIKNRDLPDDYYQLGFVQANFQDVFAKLQWSIQKHPEVEYIVLQSDYHVLSGSAKSRNHPSWSMQIVDTDRIKEIYNLGFLEVFSTITKYYFPLVDTEQRTLFTRNLGNKAINTLQGKATTSMNFDQWGDLNDRHLKRWNSKSMETRYRKASKKYDRHYSGMLAHPEMIASLRSIFEYSRKKDLKIILVKYPVTPEYQTKLKHLTLKKYDQLFRDEVVIEKLDHLKLYNNRLSLFQNADHLNYRGARTFTVRVSNKIQNIIAEYEQ